MKPNLLRVKERKEKRIIIEEEKLKNPFLLFLNRHKNFILASGIMFAVCLLLVSTGIAFSLFRGSNDYDITYIEGDDTIGSNNNPDLKDEDIAEELLGEIARAEGIVLQTKTFMTLDGDVISYFTDGTSLVVRTNGKIYRISTNETGQYGINEKGEIDDTAKKILVTSTSSALSDGTIITYYSDGSAKVEHKSQTLFIRDSNNIEIENGSILKKLNPSGVAPTRETKKIQSSTVKTFTDGTTLLIINGQKYIVNKNTEVTTTETDINYSLPNTFATIGEKKYEDGNTITHFANGSAIIEEPNGNITYVKKSSDLTLSKEKKLSEIMPKDKGNSRQTFNIANEQKVTYFDNGVAIIVNTDGTREYLEDSDNIIYDNNKKITTDFETSKQIGQKETTNGEKIYNFDNGKSQVVQKNGESYIIDTDKLKFNIKGEIIEEPEENEKPKEEEDEENKDNEENKKPEDEEEIEDPEGGIDISEAENEHNKFRNEVNNIFVIKNTSRSKKKLRIVIEEVKNYEKYFEKYNTKDAGILSPDYVKFQATVGDDYVPPTILSSSPWPDSKEKDYIIYDGIIKAGESKTVAISLKVDYEFLSSDSDQNKWFIGTIIVYVDDEQVD